MKAIAAILFLLLLLFHLIGYQLCFSYLQKQADLAMQATLDQQHYNREDLFVLRVPLALPYQTDWKDFERVDGEIKINGKIYKYVERKMEKGELVLLCIPDNHRSLIENTQEDFFKLANNLQTDAPNSSSHGRAVSFYKLIHVFFETSNYDWQADTKKTEPLPGCLPYLFQLPQTVVSFPDQPPDNMPVI
ncbi:hypothetical protein OCK74_09305 [Chitinophagaceae bacterium LB-8]|uniref:Uncharacterized protein n=1 Tax=Paraflavisolibacter caeni TaxID=2982496 RepID=A0A9X2XUJ8_9BACT|nr:hypothetical protein [Paraflavisolibacter caeni]MCU7549311.1 hypothetical protein [Paraflavisolibacter caeni]